MLTANTLLVHIALSLSALAIIANRTICQMRCRLNTNLVGY